MPWAPAVLLAFAAVHLLMLGTATALAVYKPWGKTWLGRRAEALRRTEPTGMRFDGRDRVGRVA
jgi:hypothetical protein